MSPIRRSRLPLHPYSAFHLCPASLHLSFPSSHFATGGCNCALRRRVMEHEMEAASPPNVSRKKKNWKRWQNMARAMIALWWRQCRDARKRDATERSGEVGGGRRKGGMTWHLREAATMFTLCANIKALVWFPIYVRHLTVKCRWNVYVVTHSGGFTSYDG